MLVIECMQYLLKMLSQLRCEGDIAEQLTTAKYGDIPSPSLLFCLLSLSAPVNKNPVFSFPHYEWTILINSPRMVISEQ